MRLRDYLAGIATVTGALLLIAVGLAAAALRLIGDES